MLRNNTQLDFFTRFRAGFWKICQEEGEMIV